MKSTLDVTYRFARRIVIAIIGTTLLIIGAIMIVTPGPAFVVIPMGLALLGLEFAWARNWLKKIRQSISDKMSDTRGEAAEAHRDRHRGD